MNTGEAAEGANLNNSARQIFASVEKTWGFLGKWLNSKSVGTSNQTEELRKDFVNGLIKWTGVIKGTIV